MVSTTSDADYVVVEGDMGGEQTMDRGADLSQHHALRNADVNYATMHF